MISQYSDFVSHLLQGNGMELNPTSLAGTFLYITTNNQETTQTQDMLHRFTSLHMTVFLIQSSAIHR